MSRFSKIEQGPPPEIWVITGQYAGDTFPNKVNLGMGVYRTDEGQPWVLPVVRATEKAFADDEKLNKDYLPVLGLDAFTTAATKLLLGEDSPALKENRAFGVQGISGAGSIRVGAEFLARIVGYPLFYHSAQTWDSHVGTFMLAGFTERKEYRRWSASSRGLDFDGLLEDLNNAPENSVVILDTSGHNPTGCDPTQEQWVKIADVMEKRKLFPFFDCAYQGFASGDLDKDVWSVRYFVSRGFELVCAQTFSKSFALYNERVGNLTVVTKTTDVIPKVKSQFTILIRGMYSNPLNHGARIVAHILNDPGLYEQWKECITIMSSRIIEMRKALREGLEKLNTPGDWSHITNQIGMFSFTGLNKKQAAHMIKKHHIYMLLSGRISISGLNSTNVEYVAKAIHETVTNVQ